MEAGRTEEREYRERDNDEHKLVLEVVRQNRSWTIRRFFKTSCEGYQVDGQKIDPLKTLPSESFCGRGRGTPLKFELQAGVPPKKRP